MHQANRGIFPSLIDMYEAVTDAIRFTPMTPFKTLDFEVVEKRIRPESGQNRRIKTPSSSSTCDAIDQKVF